MPGIPKLKKLDKPLLAALGTLAVLLAAALLVWLALVRPELGKGRAETISDDFSASTILEDGQTASQTFTFDRDLLALGLSGCGGDTMTAFDARPSPSTGICWPWAWNFTCPGNSPPANWNWCSPTPTPARNWPVPPA